MSDLYFCGWRPVVSRTLIGGIVLCSTLAIGSANDKGSKQKSSVAPPAVERVARAERQPVKAERQPVKVDINRSNGAGQGGAMRGGNGQGGAKFHPDFSREPHRNKLPAVRTDLTPVNQLQPGKPSSIAFLEKGDKGNGNRTGNGKTNSPVIKVTPQVPNVELSRPNKITRDVPKVGLPNVNPPKVNPPKVDKPKLETSRPEVKIRPEVKVKQESQPKVVLPKNPRVPQVADKNVQQGKQTGGPIRIKTPENSERGRVEIDNKIKVRTPMPDIKIKLPADKNVGKDIGKQIDRNVGKDVAKRIDKPVRLKDGATLGRDEREKIKLDLDRTHRELVAKGKITMPERVKIKLPEQVKVAGVAKLQKLPREAMKLSVPKNGKIDPGVATRLKLKPANEVMNLRLKNGDFKHLANLKTAQKFDLHKQFQLHHHGDVGRRMNLLAGLQHRGGWQHRFHGPISPVYASHCMPMWYAGPSFCSPYLWYPGWSPWVDWCWWDTCAPIYDPRPLVCHPVVYNPCAPWVYWEMPTWTPLPYVTCGTWVDVEPVVISSGIDLQLLATRFVDPGHPDQELGPRFRMWIRNNSPYDMHDAFNVMLIASTDANAYAGLPDAGVRVLGLRAGETQAIDIRLPFAANTMGRDSAGRAIPFTYLTALVDSHNELPEAFEANNGATLVRGDILPVDPAAFAADPGYSEPGSIVHVAGEGFGPEPGQAMVVIGDQEFQAEIVGWFDLGVQIRLPDFDLDAATAADLVVIRGDGAASNPLAMEIDPAPVMVSSITTETVGPTLPTPPVLPGE